MSLFGSTTGQPAGGGSSLFGNSNTAASQAPAPSGLFGNLNTSKPATGGGLFGAAPAASTAPTSSLFGGLGGSTASTASSQPQQAGSLFGNLGGASKPAQTGGLFGSAPAASAAPTGGLFGSTAASRPAQTGSMFGASTAQPTLGSSILQQPQQQPGLTMGQSTQQQQGFQPLSSTNQAAYFDSLLERSKKREGTLKNESDTPSLQLGLGDIARRVREIGATGQSTGAAVDGKAHYLLAASGISPGKALRDINSFNLKTSVSDSAAATDTNLESYMSSVQSKSTLAMIEEGLQRSARDFDAFLAKNVAIDREAQRKRIYEHFGLVHKSSKDNSVALEDGSGAFGKSSRRTKASPAKSVNNRAFGFSNSRKSVIGSPVPMGSGQASMLVDGAASALGFTPPPPSTLDQRLVREKQSKYAEVVSRMNDSRLNGQNFPILREFAEIELQTGGADQISKQLVDAYKALITITNEVTDPSVTAADSRVARPRKFAKDYLEESATAVAAVKLRKRITAGSRKFLEQQFFSNLEAAVAKNPREAKLGGVPSVLNKVRAYVSLRASQKDLVPDNRDLQKLADEPVWAIIFYLLRAGYVKEAAEYVSSSVKGFNTIDRNFVTYITHYARSDDRRLPRDLQSRISSEYSQRQRLAPENSIDPFRMACYKIVGRCDLGKRSLEVISQTVEDWTWLQFVLARETNKVDEVAGETFGLDDVRSVIKDIGSRHFANAAEGSAGVGTFFLLQILGGMFEAAVAYLYPYQWVDAVHFALALSYYGLLRVSVFNPTTELLTMSTTQLPQINIARMFGSYTTDFRAANVEAAVQYLVCICLNADLPAPVGTSQSSACHAALRELVLETREIAKLLGDVTVDGTRYPGVIERLLPLITSEDDRTFLKTLITQAASVAESHGRDRDAVILYHLADDYDAVIAIINTSLASIISAPLSSTPTSLPSEEEIQGDTATSFTAVSSPAELARRMISLYNTNAMYYQKISRQNREVCGILLQLVTAKNFVENSAWGAALDTITPLSLLPLTARGSLPSIRSAAQNLPHLPSPLPNLVPHVLLWTITALSNQRVVLASRKYEDQTRKVLEDEVAQRGRDLMVFAGLVKFRLGREVFDTLAREGGL